MTGPDFSAGTAGSSQRMSRGFADPECNQDHELAASRVCRHSGVAVLRRVTPSHTHRALIF